MTGASDEPQRPDPKGATEARLVGRTDRAERGLRGAMAQLWQVLPEGGLSAPGLLAAGPGRCRPAASIRA